jgi:hypothetical protein
MFYFSKRYLLSKRYSTPKMLETYVFDAVLLAVSAVPLFYGIGSLISMYIMYNSNEYFIPCIIVIIISSINILNPKGVFSKMTSAFFVWRISKSIKPT